MDEHGAEEDVVGPLDIFIAEGFHVHIGEAEVPVFGEEGGDGEQAERGEGGAFGDEGQDVAEAPESIWRGGAEEEDVHGAGGG